MTRALRGSSALVAGSVVSGLLAYVLFALVTRGLGATAAAPVSVLWTHWAVTGAAFTFPLQHWVTRSMVAGDEGQVRRAAGRVAALVVVVALALGLIAWLLRDRLFHRDDGWFPAMVVLVTLGSAAIGVVRGSLAGRARFGSVAVSLVAENAVRCLLVAALLLGGVHDPVAHGLCLVAGSVVALWPTAWRLIGDGRTAGPGAAARAFAFLGGAATGQLLGQGVLTGGPVLLVLLGGAPHEVTAMFAALALFRAPYTVVLGSVPQLTSRLTAHLVAGDRTALGGLARAVGLLVVAAPLAGVVGWLLGPAVLRLVFGTTVDIGRVASAVLACGCTLAVANLVLMVAGLARDRAVAVGLAWAAAVVVGAVALVALGATGPMDRALSVFAVTEVAATATLGVVALGPYGLVRGRISRV
jgi:O-antigen/teichoic acid export membrane protein